MRRPLNSRQLEAFRAVILAGGMTAAGKLLNISQPAISRLIRDLEDDLDLALFVRRGSRLLPTDDAIRLYQEVERLFISSDRIRSAADAIRDQRSESLRIAAMPNVSWGYLPAIIARFREMFPNVALSLHSDSSRSIIDLVRASHYDIGLGYVPSDEDPDLVIRSLPSTNAVCIMTEDHPLAARDMVRAADLAGIDFIALSDASLLKIHIDQVLKSEAVNVRVVIETRYAETAQRLVAEGLGVAIVDPFTASDSTVHGVVQRPFQPAVPYRFSLISHGYQPLSEAGQCFCGLVEQAMRRDFLD